MSACNICPRKCGAIRNVKVGYCNSGNTARVSRASLHLWEEPCISGKFGSGTVFFTGCNLRCVYCQNYRISAGDCGKELNKTELAELYLKLQENKAHNINLVTPTHFLPQIISSLEIAKSMGLNIPVVYNTSGYETPQAIRSLDGLVDVYLTDFKYMSEELAKKYSCALDYPEVAKRALYEMVSQVGTPFYSEDGLLQSGVIVRHLILPNCTDDSKRILKYLYENYGNTVLISIMNQFTPLENVSGYPELNRKITEEEYTSVVDYAVSLGITDAFIQEGETASESFIPDFDCGEFLSKI